MSGNEPVKLLLETSLLDHSPRDNWSNNTEPNGMGKQADLSSRVLMKLLDLQNAKRLKL